jgi:signal transduction histidine kinase
MTGPSASAPKAPLARGSLRSRLTRWLLSHLIVVPTDKFKAATMVAALVTLIGYSDLLLRTPLSLQLFYLVPVTMAVAWLGWRMGCVTALVCVAVRIACDYSNGVELYYPHTWAWNRVLEFSVYCAVVWIFHALITLHRRLEQRVEERTAALEESIAIREQLQEQVFESARCERSAIGHELHDGLGQHLTATALAAEVLAKRVSASDPAEAQNALRLVKLIQQAVEQTRQIARGLLLSEIAPNKLIAELEELAAKSSRQGSVPCRFTVRGHPQVADTPTASHLYRIAHEAVHNALHHGKPRRVAIDLTDNERVLALTITDDGTGLPASRSMEHGLGLKIMAHRAGLIGGQLAVEAVAGGGTRVLCRVPANRARARQAT